MKTLSVLLTTYALLFTLWKLIMTAIVESLPSRRNSRDLYYLVYRLVGCLMGTTTLCCCLFDVIGVGTDRSLIRYCKVTKDPLVSFHYPFSFLSPPSSARTWRLPNLSHHPALIPLFTPFSLNLSLFIHIFTHAHSYLITGAIRMGTCSKERRPVLVARRRQGRVLRCTMIALYA